MKIESKTRKAIMGFIVFLAFIIAFGVYFFYFVEERKEDLSRKNFSILAQVSENIVDKVNTYSQNIENVKRLLGEYKDIGDKMNKLSSRKDQAITTSNVFTWLKQKGAINKSLTLATNSSENFTPGVIIEENFIVKNIEVFNENLTIKQDLHSFLATLLWQDDFDEYLIVDNNSKVVYQNGHIGIFEMSVDSLVTIKGGNNSVKASSSKEVILEGNKYKLFAYPFRLTNEQKFVLIGLRSAKAFDEQSMHISSLTVVTVATVFFLLLLSFPFIKLFLISKTERLNRSDIIMCMISLFTITCLVSLLTLDMFQYKKYSNQDIQKNLKSVSKTLETHLKKEMLNALTQLKIYDSIYAQTPVSRKANQINLLSDSVLEPTTYRDFDFIFWITESGMQTNKWTVKSQNTSPIDVNSRKYYSKIQDKSGWSWKDKGFDLFFLESIYSLNTGKSYAALSLPSIDKNFEQKSEVIAMTTELGAIFDPVLSHGYKFALINADGEVLFHSDKRRNLQENFLHDISNQNAITSSINSRVFNTFSTSYHGDNYEACIQPLNSWPVFLVTMYDTSYFKSANAEILSICIIMLGIYGGIVLIIFIIIYASSHSPSKLQFRKTRLNWLIPHPYSSRLYQQSATFSLLLGAIFTICFLRMQEDYHATYSQLMILAMLCPFYMICGNYFILNRRVKARVFIKRQFPVFLFCGSLVVLINFFTAYLGIPLTGLITFQILVLVVFFFLRMILYKWRIRFFKYPFDYKVAILTFLLAICLIPVFTFFKVSHDTEFRLYTKLVQLKFASALDKTGPLEQLHEADSDSTYLKVHPSPMVEMNLNWKTKNDTMTSDPVFNHLYSKLRVKLSDKISETQYLNDTAVVGSNWSWVDGLSEVTLNYNSKNLEINGQQPSFYSNISDYNLELKKPINVLGFIAIASLLISLLYLLISFIFRKTVMSKLLQQARPLLLDIDLFGSVFSSKKDNDDHKDKNVFLIGLPNSGKTQFIHDRILKRNSVIHKIDLALLRDHSVEDLWNDEAKLSATLILDHFEYGLHDPEIIRKKLILMENINSYGNISTIAVSTLHPLEMIDSQMLQNTTDIEAQEASNISERWVRVLGNFYTSNYTIAFTTNIYKEELEDLDVVKLIESECRYGAFLKNLEKDLKKYASANPVSNDEIILKIQTLATFYYLSLWKSCTPDEKYLLYDLAQDGLVNTRNVKVIASLVNKGLVLSLGTLTIFNRSFRNFILNTVNPEEALALEASVKKSSTWGVIRVPLLLTLLALGLFIFYTQRQVFNNALAVMATMAAALPMVLKLLNSFQAQNKQQ
ncbi:cache domain-containing protein [Owenweeksia hongkongensis]|uniref:cache domain-containing protein n=1 Tax=Owenweeksia hongkongensis TaxID=253245 RepID=UPI003A916D69